MSTTERSGWRDQALSERHREWGTNCPCVDVDFLLCEYDGGEPVALISYKKLRDDHGHEGFHDENKSNKKSLSLLSTRAGIPCWECWYTIKTNPYGKPLPSGFKLVPLNDVASKLDAGSHFSERQFVRFLYRIRNRLCPPDVESILQDVDEFEPARDTVVAQPDPDGGLFGGF